MKTHYCDRQECIEDRRTKRTVLAIEVTSNDGKVYTLSIKEGARYEFDNPVRILIRREVIRIG